MLEDNIIFTKHSGSINSVVPRWFIRFPTHSSANVQYAFAEPLVLNIGQERPSSTLKGTFGNNACLNGADFLQKQDIRTIKDFT